MKKVILFSFLTAGMHSLYAQHTHHSTCGSNYHVSMENPEFAAEQVKFNQYVQQYAQSADERAGDYRIMPVVVHIIHDGGSSNVTNAQVNTMITRLNQAYSKTPPNINTLPLRFDSIAGEAKIEFRLATKDPLGNCTDGIRRIYAPQKSKDCFDDKDFKKLSYWDRAKYLNIWVVDNIVRPGDDGSSILAYAYYPGEAPALRDGVTTNDASMVTQAVVPHEVGHHLNLIHIWGDSFCGDDQVDDTPISATENFAWPNPCGTAIKEATCYQNVVDNPRDSILRFAVGENYQNFMDYVNNYNCPNMFTEGQIQRMNAALNFYPFRKSVVTESNNIITGTEDNAPACVAKAPVAEFWTTKNMTCAGATITFVDGSFNGTPISWAWEFEGGTPATSNLQNPTITYLTPGTYSVSLTVTNASGTSTKMKQNTVFVLHPEVESKAWGYSEGFESGGLYDQGRWTVINDQTDPGKEWALSPLNVSYTGVRSIKMNNYNNIRDNNSSLISPALDMDAISGTNKVIRFKVAYALRTNETLAFDQISQSLLGVMNDKLSLSRSTDCGQTWSNVKTFTLAEILSGGLSPSNFNPTSLTLWKQVSVNLGGTTGSGSNVRYRFHFISGGPHNNNLFIDDIQIIATSGPNASIDEVSADVFDINVYPNPVTENSVLTFNLPSSVGKGNIGMYDVAGRFITIIYTGTLQAGEQTFNISREHLNASGVYFVKIDLDGKTMTRKIIVQ